MIQATVQTNLHTYGSKPAQQAHRIVLCVPIITVCLVFEPDVHVQKTLRPQHIPCAMIYSNVMFRTSVVVRHVYMHNFMLCNRRGQIYLSSPSTHAMHCGPNLSSLNLTFFSAYLNMHVKMAFKIYFPMITGSNLLQLLFASDLNHHVAVKCIWDFVSIICTLWVNGTAWMYYNIPQNLTSLNIDITDDYVAVPWWNKARAILRDM